MEGFRDPRVTINDTSMGLIVTSGIFESGKKAPSSLGDCRLSLIHTNRAFINIYFKFS